MTPFPMESTDAAFIPADAVLGTREHPFTASQATTAQFMHKRVLCSTVQQVAQVRLAAGLAVDWDTWAGALARLLLWAPAGWYESEEWDAPRRWPAPTPEWLLLAGKGAPFRRRADIPHKVLVAVAKAIEAAKVAGPSVLSPAGLARVLNVTAAFRREHKLWALGAVDATKAELRAQSRRLSAARKAADRTRKAIARRAAGKATRSEYLDRAALRREACALAGISQRTFGRRSPAEQAALLAAVSEARGASPSTPHNIIGDSCEGRTDFGHCAAPAVAPPQSGARHADSSILIPATPSAEKPALRQSRAGSAAKDAGRVPGEQRPRPPLFEICRIPRPPRLGVNVDGLRSRLGMAAVADWSSRQARQPGAP